MAVSNLPNAAYIIESIMADLRQISIGNGYRTDLKAIELPSWSYEDRARFSQVETPALLLWLDSDVKGTTLSNHQELRPALIFTVVGIVRRADKLQEAMLLLSQDVRRVMMANPQRNHPANLTQANTWGVLTEEEGGVDFKVHRNEQGVTIGIFTSSWRVDYRYPIPAG